MQRNAFSQLRRALCTVPVSRKSRKLVDVQHSFDFNGTGREAITKIRHALEPVRDMNSGYELTFTEDSVILDTMKKGKYIFTLDQNEEKLNVQSPVSGTFQYFFDRESNQWLSSVDGHDMRGLVTRDLLRHCRGLPNF